MGLSVVKIAEACLPTVYGKFQIFVYRSPTDNQEHVAFLLGKNKSPMLTRLQSSCLTGDTFGSLLCDCGQQLKTSFRLIKKAGSGIILYLNQEGRGIGLANKIKAYALQQTKGLDTVEANKHLGFPADERDYKIAADILKNLRIKKITLLTNNPDKIKGLKHNGVIVKRRALEIKPGKANRDYLATKKQKLGHLLKLV